MALFKHNINLHRSDSKAFDDSHPPHSTTPHTGIYRCINCGDEVASNKGDLLPPQNHRPHDPNQGPVLWRLVVYAETK